MIEGMGQAYRRHIVIDNIARVIYIEVQADLRGSPKLQEYQDIAYNKQWYKYVPSNIRQQLSDVINGGYRVQPMFNFGAMTEEYYIIQITSLEEKTLIPPKKFLS